MANSVRIKIGGEIDPSLARSLASANSQIQRAAKQAQRSQKETSSAAAAEARKQLKAQEALTKATESLDRQRSRALYGQFQAQAAGAERAAKAQMQAAARSHAAERREIEKTVRLAQRAFEQESRAAARSAAAVNRRSANQGESFARRTSHRASRFLMPEAPIGPMVMRGLGDVARGAGVDFSIQGMVSRNVGLQAAATDLSNSGYQAGNAGPNGQRVDPRALVQQARTVGGQLGIDAGEALAGLTQFQKITGDLATGRALLSDMARLAKATGTDLGDMAAAAANVSNGLGDTPNKAAVLDQVMRTIAGQGKLGAVEISDMAVQMARVAASATKFAGDRGQNIAKMGALAQIARAEGGAPSAAESARSVGGFAATMQKTARIKAFKAKGIDVFSDDSHTQLKDPIALIKESLMATGGDLQEMNKLFMDVIGARAVGGLQKTFVGAGGKDAGLKAVDAQVSRMLKAQISQDEVNESAKRASETDAAKAARFQNSLDAITETTMKTLVPALEQAGPAILQFAEVIGKVATWATTNPKTAIAAAISASIARAGIESGFRAGIERLILGANDANGTGTRAGAVGNLVSKAGGVLTIAALGVTTLTVGMAIIDNWFLKAQREQSEAVAKGAEATNLGSEAAALEKSGNLKGALEKQKESVAAKEEEIKRTEALKGGGVGDFLMKMLAASTSTGLMSGSGIAGIKGPANETEAALKARDVALENATRQQLKELTAARGFLDRIATAVEQQAPLEAPGEGRGTN
jgi:hypothetical protein